MADYQLVDYIETDSVYDGKLFTFGDSLIMLYLPTVYEMVEYYRIFDISDPHNTITISSGVLPIYSRGISYYGEEDAGYALLPYNNELTIIPLKDLTYSSIDLKFPSMIYSVKLRNGYLYLGCYNGLHIWDVSTPGNYHEIFVENDTIRRWWSQLSIQDSILLVNDMNSHGRYVKWNIVDPTSPQKIREGFLPAFNSFYFKDSILIGFAGGDEEVYSTLFRYIYRDDSFTLAEYKGYEDYFWDNSYTDSIIYARGSRNICIFSAQDLTIRDSIHPLYLNPWDMVSMANHDAVIYVLTRTGLAVYERSTQ